MKKLVFVLALLLSIQNFYGQCYPVFSQMPKQRLNTLPFPGEVGYNSTFFYAISGFNYMTYDIWDGKNWDFIKLPADTEMPKGSSFGLAKLNNTYVAFGKISYFNKMRAPKGKYFGFIRYKNGVWDTLPGCLVDSVNYYTNGQIKSGFSTDNNLYAMTRISGSRGYIHRYDTTVNKFVVKAEFDEGLSLSVLAGANRLLIGGIVRINGTNTNGFAYIDGDSIIVNNDPVFNDKLIYGLDRSNDHVYAFNRDADPVVYEFGNQLIQIRKTSTKTAINTYPIIHDGRMMCSDMVLCPGETAWKKISLNESVNHVATKDGIFGLHFQDRTVMELTTGAKISGIAFMDLDSNCNWDTLNEPVLKRKEISAVSKKFKASVETDQNGYFEFFVTLDSFQLKGPGRSSACFNSSLITNSLGKDYDVMVPVLKPTKYDTKVTLLNGHSVRWNSNVRLLAVVENLGLPYDSAYYEFDLDHKLKFIAGDSTVKSTKNGIIRGQLKNLDYFEKRYIGIVAWVDSSKSKRDSVLCTGFSASLYTTEYDVTNNTDNVCQTVVYSLDPNHKDCDKEIIPKAISTKLNYFIGFQNEGNDYAEDVVIVDTLTSLVSVETLKILGTSHPYSVTIDGRVLTVTFKGIFLKPKKENETLSQGFVKFSIQTIQGLNIGDKINNKAYIYFDLNQPVITNTSVVVIEKDLIINKTETIYNKALLAYPNPTQGILQIKTNSADVIQVYSLTGAILKTGSAENGMLEVDMTAWPAGLYFIRCGSLSSKVLKTE